MPWGRLFISILLRLNALGASLHLNLVEIECLGGPQDCRNAPFWHLIELLADFCDFFDASI